jgi:uncharacterized protein (TIGR02646 family)
MHKLDRTTVAAPPCLAQYQHGANTWDDLSSEDKKQIWVSLEQMQGQRCAYCEGPLGVLGRHIEHFRRKSIFPGLTFAWPNLYGSCDREDCCGHHKDKKSGGWPYNPNELIDPCNDDPDHFFHFYSDGTIRVRAGLTPLDLRRATETLRVFNLDQERGHLRSMRKRAIEAYQAVEPGILEALSEWPDADRRAFLREELARTAGEPFSTVIRHLFQDLL